MLEFPKDYFKDEIREGFLVSEMMKRTWASQFEIFDRIRSLCEKYDITYFAEVGTLLGAARHKGIIPWDDDIDIAMLRRDFHRFLEHSGEIGEGLCVRSVYSSDSFYNFHAIVTHEADTLDWDKERMEKYHGCPFICAVDIFPLDYYPQDAAKREIYIDLYCYAYRLVWDCVKIEDSEFKGTLATLSDIRKAGNPEFVKRVNTLPRLIKKYLGKRIEIDEKRLLRNRLCRITEMVASSCTERDAAGVEYCPKLPLGIYSDRPKAFYDGTCLLPFEMTTISAPIDYNGVLANIYGRHYMTPLRGRAGHDYPFFKSEVNVLVNGDVGELYLYSDEKRYIVDTIDILEEARSEMAKNAMQGDKECAIDIMGQMQDLAAGLGNYIESMTGESSFAVKMLEEYCDDVYAIYDRISKTEEKEGCSAYLAEMSGKLKGDMTKVRRAVFGELCGELPAKYEKLMQHRDAGKRCVLIGISATGIINNTFRETDRLKAAVGGYASENTGMVIFASKGLKDFIERCSLEIKEEYYSLLEYIKTLPMTVFAEDAGTSDIDAALCICDTYVGDECRLSGICTDAGMTVTVLDYN